MLRVLVLSTLFPDSSRPGFGGFVERQARALADRKDVEVQLVAPVGIPPWPLSQNARYRSLSQLPHQEMWNGIPVYRPRFTLAPIIATRLRPAFMAHALKTVLRDIRADFPFDVIDAEFFYPDGPAAMHLAKVFDVPLSITARGSDIHFWTKKSGAAAKIRRAAEKADGLIAVSQALRTDMIEIGMQASKVDVHYTGVDHEKFAVVDRDEAKRKLGVEKPLIVSIGALIPLKRQALVVDAMLDIPAAQLWLIGEGPERTVLESQIKALGLSDRVQLIGTCPHSDIPAYLAAADVMALPSTMEGLPNAWVESLACGTPIVITDVGGAREIVKTPEAGAIVSGESGAIAAAINAILTAPPDRKAVQDAVSHLSWDESSEKLENHFRRLVSEHRQERAA